MPQGAQFPFEGVLNCWNDEHDLPDLLLFIGRSAKTGILQFSNPRVTKPSILKTGRSFLRSLRRRMTVSDNFCCAPARFL